MLQKHTGPASPLRSIAWLLVPILLLLLSACATFEGPFILETEEDPIAIDDDEALGAQDEVIEITEVEAAGAEEEGADVDENEVAAEEVALEQTLARATFLLDLMVTDPTGEKVGEIEDFIIDTESGQILYAILERGELLELDEDQRPVPLAALEWNADLHMTLTVASEMLDLVPAVDEEWPGVVEAGWDAEVTDFWRAQEPELVPTSLRAAVPARLRALIGLHAGGLGPELAVVEDFLVDLSQGESAYVVLYAPDGFYEPEHVLILPVSVANLEVEVVDDVFAVTLLAVDESLLAAAPSMNRNLFLTIDLLDATFTEELDAYWREVSVQE